jgi:malate dehydrogenase (oxaloacetate-decarboxylating)
MLRASNFTSCFHCDIVNSNNLYTFPGLALGAKLVQAARVTDNMLMAASEALAATNKPHDLRRGKVYPGQCA